MRRAAEIGLAIVALSLTSCHSNKSSDAPKQTSTDIHEIKYISSDGEHAMVFSDSGARSGSIEALRDGAWPTFPLKKIEIDKKVQCISIGPPGNTEEFAIKRPIKLGEQYRCLGTIFKVSKCFENCSSAIIDREVPATGDRFPGLTVKSYILVDRCIGLLAYSQIQNMAESIPLNAVLLREKIGVLADNNYPNCQ